MTRCILLYTYSWYPKLDGVTVRYDGIVRHLLSHGYRVVLCIPDRPLGDTRPAPPSWFQTHPQCTLVTLPSQRMSDLFYPDTIVYCADPTRFLQLRRILASLICAHHVDLLHITLPDAILPLFHLLASTYQIPLLGVYHTDVYNYLPATWVRRAFWLGQRCARMEWLSCLATTSESMQRELETQGFTGGPSSRYILPPCVNTTLFTATPPTKHPYWSTGTIRLLYVGRIEREKSIQRILHAMDTGMCLVVVGAGSQRPALTRLGQALGVDVRFMGALPQAELAAWYSSTDFYIMPSGTETLGFSTMEAMACGACTLGFAAGGTLDLIQDRQNGLLWSTVEALTALIHETYPRTVFRQRLCRAAETTYVAATPDRSAADLVRTYERLVAAEAPRTSAVYRSLYCYGVMVGTCCVYWVGRILDQCRGSPGILSST